MGEGIRNPSLRDMYDPTGAYKELTDAELFAEVADNRESITLTGFGPITPYESMVLEARHSLIPTPDELLAQVPEERAAELIRFDAERVRTMIGHIAFLSFERQLLEERRLGGYEMESSSIDTVDGKVDTMLFAARTLAHIAHHGVSRRSGDPYIIHPESVASIVDVGWKRSAKDQSGDTLRSHKAVAYLHDTFEDTITSDGSYLAHDIVASPLVIRGLLARYDFPYPKEVAQAVRLMTHNKGALPLSDKLPYADYIERGVALGGAQFAIPKAADIQHNSRIDVDVSIAENETEEEKKLRRAAKYANSKQELLRSVEHFPDSDSRWVLHAIFNVTAAQMERTYGQLKDIRLQPDDLSPFRDLAKR